MSARPCCVYAVRLEDALLEYIGRYGLTEKAMLAFSSPCKLSAKEHNNQTDASDDSQDTPGGDATAQI
jgi:hypothetical protein